MIRTRALPESDFFFQLNQICLLTIKIQIYFVFSLGGCCLIYEGVYDMKNYNKDMDISE